MDRQFLIETCGPLLDYLDRHGKTRVADVPDLNKDVVRLAFSHRLVGFSILVDGEWGWCVGSFDVAINDRELFLGIESAGRQALSAWRLRRLAATQTPTPGTEMLVTLAQAAAMVNRTKRTLQRHVGKMPPPRVEGGGGRPAEWAWSEIRPWLEKEYCRKMPEVFPADRSAE